MLNGRALRLHRLLEEQGVNPLRMDHGTDKHDPIIWVTDNIHIQVGLNFVAAIKKTSRGIRVYPCEYNIDSVMNSLRKAINDERHKANMGSNIK